MRINEVAKALGIRERTAWKRHSAGQFPAPIAGSKPLAWRAEDVVKWAGNTGVIIVDGDAMDLAYIESANRLFGTLLERDADDPLLVRALLLYRRCVTSTRLAMAKRVAMANQALLTNWESPPKAKEERLELSETLKGLQEALESA